jgi:hypothetical protein
MKPERQQDPCSSCYEFSTKAKFAASFASDVKANAAGFMANSQVPWGVDALAETISDAARRT